MKKELKDAWEEKKRLRVVGHKLSAKGDKIRAKGDKLWEKGHLIFLNAIKKEYGNIKYEWKSTTHCILENGVEFK